MFLFILFAYFLKGPANEDFLSCMLQPCSEVKKKKIICLYLMEQQPDLWLSDPAEQSGS